MLVSLKKSHVPIAQALAELFGKAHIRYVFDQPVKGDVTFQVSNVSFRTALDALLVGNNPPLDFSVTDGIYHIRLWKPEPPHLRDVESSDQDFWVQSTMDTQIDIPPGTPSRISGPAFPTHLAGQVVVRPRVPHKTVRIVPAASGDQILLQSQSGAAPETFDLMNFDTASMTVEVTAEATVLRDKDGHSLTIYVTALPIAEPTQKP